MACSDSEQIENFEKFAFKSHQSLLEFDIVLWDIEFLHFDYFLASTNGIQDLKQLLQDRRRRLNEIEIMLQNGKSLAVLLSKSELLSINFTEPYGEFGPKLHPEINEFVDDELLRAGVIDTYSFLPPKLEMLIRENTVVAGGKKMICGETPEFSTACQKLIGKAWYNSYFINPIGYPLMYLENGPYSVACWLRYLNGNVFLLPGTEYDDSDDYPLFVDVVEKLVEISEKVNYSELDVPIISSDITTVEFGANKMTYIDSSRLAELQALETTEYDLTKLIRLCEEINICYSNKCYLATAMLTRAILDHVPPIFECGKFLEVANNYSGAGRSFKETMLHMVNSSKKIADSYLHLQIRNKESLPNKTQVDFRSDLDVLLGEIVRVLK